MSTCETKPRVLGIRVMNPIFRGWGIVLVVQFGICDQIPRAGRVLEGAHQRLRPFLEHCDVRGIAIPTFAHKGHHRLETPSVPTPPASGPWSLE